MVRPMPRLALVAGTVLVVLAGPAFAQVQPRDFLPARAVAMPANRAVSTGNEAIFANPAGLAAASRYTAQLDYQHATGTATGGNGIVVSVVDSVSNPTFSTGIAYRYLSTGNGGGYQGWMTDLAVGVPVLGLFFLGTRVSYLSYTANGRDLKRFTGDVGFLVPLGPLTIGAVGTNLINVDSPEAPRGFAGGLAFGDDRTFRLAADLRYDFVAGAPEPVRSLSLGGEYFLGGAFPLRAGWEWDDLRGNRYLTGGIGAIAGRIGADVSVRVDKDGVYQWAFALQVYGG
jgi:hypothetical protein